VSCGAPLAADQRYCLECGERRTPMSSVLLGGPPTAEASPSPDASVPARDAWDPSATERAKLDQRNTVTVIAGVGVLLLAMGVGVLIGRAGGSKQIAAPAQVITVASGPAAGTPAPAAAAAAVFSDDWPSGTTGYTVRLQTLPQSGTAVSAVEAATAAASAKGAKGVGALKSEDFSSLTAGSYVIYAGVYHKKPEAEKALVGLKKSFAGAAVITVSNGSSTASQASAPASSGSGAGSSLSHPAPPTVVRKLSTKKGKSYEQESKNLPDVISTG
jgi:hypothetical protein